MDFLTATRLLMALREVDPQIGYHFDGDVLVIRREIWCLDGTAKMFEDAKRMFEPVED